VNRGAWTVAKDVRKKHKTQLSLAIARGPVDLKRAWGRALPTRWNLPADGASRVACPCPSFLALRHEVPAITLSGVKLKNTNYRSLGTMPLSDIIPVTLLRRCHPRPSVSVADPKIDSLCGRL
jgi:hypothetical protein